MISVSALRLNPDTHRAKRFLINIYRDNIRADIFKLESYSGPAVL